MLLIATLPQAAAAVPTAVSVLPSDPIPGATSNLTFSWSGYQTASTVRCVQIDVTTGYQPASTLYPFSANNQGWGLEGGGGLSWSSTAGRGGGGGAQITRDWGTVYSNVRLRENANSSRNLSTQGSTLATWIYLPAGVTTAFTATHFVYNSSYTGTSGSDQPLVAGAWTLVADSFSSTVMSGVQDIGISISSNGNTGTATLTIDDVGIGTTAGAPATSPPTGMVMGSAALSGTYVGSGWTANTSALNAGRLIYRDGTGVVPSGSTSTLVLSSMSQPPLASGHTVHVAVTAYSAIGSGSSCGGSVLDGPARAAYRTTPSTEISIVVEPTLLFTVGAHGGACNGATQTGSASSTTANLGRVTGSSIAAAAQSLQLQTNAGGGFVVRLRSAAPTAPVLRTATNQQIADAAGTPGALSTMFTGAESFGYTVTGGGVNYAAAGFARVPVGPTGDTVVSGSAGTQTATACVAYAATAASTTAAGSYTTTVIYTATPTY